MKTVRLLQVVPVLLAMPIWAAEVTVNSDTDIQDANPVFTIPQLIAAPGDDGVISLREAIQAANNTAGTDTINFAEDYTILLSGDMAAISDALGTIIDGTGRAIVIDGNGKVWSGPSMLLSRNSVIKNISLANCLYGITLALTTACRIEGCRIGLDGGNTTGIYVTTGAIQTKIGGAGAGEGNIISNNEIGVLIDGGASLNEIKGNRIGTDAAGTSAQPNTVAGVKICAGAAANVVGGVAAGAGNLIAYNTVGVIIADLATVANQIRRNSIFANDDGAPLTPDGIRLEGGANGGVTPPVITAVSPVVSGTASANATVEIFADDGGQGRLFIESVPADGDGGFTGTVDVSSYPYEGLNITATATSAANHTSEFSAPESSPMVPPEVASIIRNNPSPTNKAQVAFTVTFSEEVTGIETGAGITSDDFELSTAGKSVTSAAISAVSGGGDEYIVTVSTGQGDGPLRLDVLATGGIRDLADNPMATDYVDGPAYLMEHIKFTRDLPPQTSAVKGQNVTLEITAQGGFDTLHYQWFKDTEAKAPEPVGSDAPTLILFHVRDSDAGTYYVTVTDGNEVVTSSATVLSVSPKVPVIGVAGMAFLAAVLGLSGARQRRRF